MRNHGGHPPGRSEQPDVESERETERSKEVRTHSQEGRARGRDKEIRRVLTKTKKQNKTRQSEESHQRRQNDGDSVGRTQKVGDDSCRKERQIGEEKRFLVFPLKPLLCQWELPRAGER